MIKKYKHIKSFFAIAIFISFWAYTFIFICNKEVLQTKVANVNWAYSQAFSQSWNFFTQPALYNDKLIVILEDRYTHKQDSVDVLQLLWQEKRNNFNYAYANVWDHVMYRSLVKLHEKQKIIYIDTSDDKAAKDSVKLINPAVKSELKNIDFFAETYLKRNNYLTKNKKFQIQLYYQNFKSNFRKVDTSLQLIYKSVWKEFSA